MRSYSDDKDKGLLDINYVDTSKKVNSRDVILFSTELSSKLNDGPATFNRNGDTVYFSRNQNIDFKVSKILGTKNKLGIFSSVFRSGKWTEIKEFRYNIEWYNFTTPCLSPDGHRLFFASDMPGGMGGLDLYYCDLKNGYWNDPVNLGPVINTDKDEAYPFMNGSYELFFSSDGHDGLGGLDIFVTKQDMQGWYAPINLEAPINSESDDLGILTDRVADKGYFSSNRGKTFDIYNFDLNWFHFWFAESQKENRYCFSVSDIGKIEIDTMRLQYIWNFGDGSKLNGLHASHCFQAPGAYSVNLDIIDRKTGKLFFNKLRYDLDVINTDQPFISSQDVALKGEHVEFDGLRSYTPGFSIAAYYWAFGDGKYGTGDRIDHVYLAEGEYEVSLGVILRSDSNSEIIRRAVKKKITIVTGIQGSSLRISETNMPARPNITSNSNIKIRNSYSAEVENLKMAEFQVIILSSRNRIPLGSPLLKKVPPVYNVKELFDPESGFYNYIVDQQMELMHTYPAFKEMISLGYNDAIVRIYPIENPAEKELHNLRIKYGILTDVYFDAAGKLMTNGILMLNQIAVLMKRYPEIFIEIGVHTDNQGDENNNQRISQLRAQAIVDYLIGTGMNGRRLRAIGYGGTKPVVPNTYPTDRRLNRRVEFSISNQ